MLRQLLVLALLVFACAFQAAATHVVGGELTYQHISGDNYQVTLKLFRDCGPGNASFPSPVRLRAFYDSGNNYVEASLTASSIVLVPPVVDTCVIQPDICVQEAIYTGVMNLPQVDGGYHIMFDTGNRNASIDNLVNPLSAGEGFYIQFPDSLFRDNTVIPDTLWFEDFDLPDGAFIDSTATSWTRTTPGSGTVDVQGGLLEANDLGGQNVFWCSDTVDISAYPNGVTVSMDVSEQGGFEDDDTLRVTYVLDNAAPVEFETDGFFINDIPSGAATPSQTNIIGNELIIKIQFRNTSASETYRVDNVLIRESAVIDTLIVDTNSTPVYNEFPPIFLCVQEAFTFDHSATDADGDSLSYYLCTPYEAWNSSPWSTNSVGPPAFTAAGLPIIDSITWIGGFSGNNPMGGNTLSIDPITGSLTGTPPNIGQFVVGVCVDEFRDGHRISTNKRDFQFNTLQCPKPVEAIIDTLPITVCDGDPLVFPNLTDPQFINTWDWAFGDGTTLADTSDIRFPTYLYPDTGTYEVTLIVNLGSACSDTDTVAIDVTWVEAAFTTNPLGCDGVAHSFTQTATSHPSSVLDTYAWDFGDGQTGTGPTPTNTYAASGVYTVTLTVTDTSGCSDVTTQDVTIQQQPTATAPADFILCAGAEEVILSGSVTEALGATWTGGVGTYAPTADSVYTVYSPTDAEKQVGTLEFVITTTGVGCTPTTDTVEVTWQGVLAQELATTLTSCPGICDGTATVGTLQGTAPFTYAWQEPGMQTTALAVGLCEGQVDVIVSDALVCKDTLTITISPPFVIEANLDSTDITCTGLTDGTATSTPSNGMAPYTYLWNDGPMSTTAAINVLAPGFYVVTVSDNNGCFSIDSIEINDPGVILLPDTKKDACDGACNGEIVITPSQGTPPYTYLWDPGTGGQTDSIADGLCSGTYTITVTDVNGCTNTKSRTVSSPPGVSLATDSVGLGCVGECSGQTIVTPTLGALPYTYLWSDGAGQTDSIATGLCAGGYTVTVTYGAGCTDSVQVRVSQPDPLEMDSTVIDACAGLCNGSASVAATGGTSPYTFMWGPTAASQVGANATNLCVGTHKAFVADSRSCRDSLDVTVSSVGNITLATDSTDMSCFGVCDGTVTITPGSPGTYTYLWNDPMNQSTPTATGLCAGRYKVTMTFTNGCTVVDSSTVNEPAVLSGVVSPAPVSCGGICDGSALVVPAGGTSPYTYLWSDPGNTTASLAFNFCAGAYTVSVTDANNCMTTASGTVGSPGVLAATISVVTDYNGSDISCFGAADATVGVVVSGGVPAYTYQWDAGTGSQQGTQANNLGPGTYTITISDGNGCDTIYDILVAEPAQITTTAAVTSNYNGSQQSCFMANDAAATATPAGGTPPYTYIWAASAGNQSTQTATGLGAGTHNVVVRDANNCGTIAVPNVFQTPILDPSVSVTSDYNGEDVSCNGASDGAATASAVGGTGARTYTWDANAGSQTTATATGLAAGTYSVSVADANGCDTAVSVTLTEPPAMSLSVSATSLFNGVNVSCNGAGDGSIAASASGGIGSIRYMWNAAAGSAMTATVNGLGGGTYIVSVTDSNSCQLIDSVTLVEPGLLGGPVAVSSNFNGSDVSCNGATDGQATLTTSGGTPSYTYLWSAGASNQTTTTATGLGAGTYTITITDANGCDTALSVTVSEPAVISVTATAQTPYNGRQVSCFQSSDGSATATPAGGTAPYTYVWAAATGGQNTPTATGLAAGTYSVVVRDANNCATLDIANVFQTPELTPTIAVSSNYNGEDVSCFGASDGSATAGTGGGTAPYTYSWGAFAGSQTTATATGLSAGNYSVTIADINGCDTLVSITLTEPDSLEAGASTTSNYNGVGVSCFGESDGSVSSTAAGGIAAYTYTWSTGAATAAVNNLAAGTYTVSVEDANGCVETQSTIVTTPVVISSSISVITNYNGEDISCFGASDGAASASPAGGTTPYTYSWSTGASSSNITGQSSGTYTVTITDVNGCDTVYDIALADPPQLTVTAAVTSNYNGQDVSCFNAADGTVAATPGGGVPTYTYAWPASAASQNTPAATGLAAGTYTITLADANSCTATAPVTVAPAPQLMPTIAVSSNYNGEDVSCYNAADGSATVSMAGGTSPYTYAWDAFAGNQSTATATGLSAGNYSITVQDANACDTVVSITLTEPDSLQAAATTTSNYNGVGVSCLGALDGAVNSGTLGGTTPYTYSWSSGAAIAAVNGLGTGTYTVTVEDANGCIETQSTNISSPTALTGSTSITTNYNGEDISCFGASDGAVSVSAAGGIPSYTYSWSSGSGNSNANSLAAGTYTVTIEDANGCDTTYSVTLTEPSAIAINATITSNYNGRDLSCFGASDGAATAAPSGGVPGYTYIWAASTGGQNTPTATGLAAGTYSVVVRDANNCATLALVNVTQTPQLTTTVAATNVSVSCAGVCDGSAVATPAGGTGIYTYNWSNGDVVGTASALCPGITQVTVTDANGCTVNDVTVIAEPSTNVVNMLAPSNVSCFGGNDGSAQAMGAGGTPPYTYVWGNGVGVALNTTLMAGINAVTVTDNNGCVASNFVTTTEPDLLEATTAVVSDFNGQDVSCFGASDGSASVAPIGGTTPYTYLWDANASNQTDSIATGLPAGVYLVTVTDNNACDTIVDVTLTEPVILGPVTSVTTNYNGEDISCFAESDGAAEITTTGGTAPYTWLWDANAAASTDSSVTGLPANTYNVTVTDLNGCDSVVDVTITQPALLIAATLVETNFNGRDISCFGENDGSASATPMGGTGAISYLWDANAASQTDSIATGLTSGTYSITVTDVNSCDTIVSIALVDPPELEADTAIESNFNGAHISCFGLSDGSVSVTPTGGTAGYTFQWDASASSQTDSIATGLPAGQYAVVVTDVNSCDTTVSITVIEPPLLEAVTAVLTNYNGTDISCFGLSDANVHVVPMGGTLPLTYAWDALTGSQTDSVATALAAGTYTVTVTDVNGCDSITDVTVTEPPLLEAVTAVTTNYNGQDISCFSENDGAVSVTPTGGNGLISYVWDAGAGSATDSTVANLIAGTYTVTVTDINGCDTIVDVTVTEPPLLTATTAVESDYNGRDISCFGLSDGIVSTTPTGGTGIISYQWDINASSQTDSIATGLPSGLYSVFVSDVNNCDTVVTITLVDPPLLVADTAIVSDFNGQHISCFGRSDGSVSVTPIGGTAAYTYQWDATAGSQTDSVATGLPAGQYTVLVTDTNNCDTTVSITLIEPPLLEASTAVLSDYNGEDISCFGLSDASVHVVPLGGTQPLTYAWDSLAAFQTDSMATALMAGTYSVTVTDVNGCDTTVNITVTEPPLLEATTSVTTSYTGEDISCFGLSDGAVSVTPTGGTGISSYAWDSLAGFATDSTVANLAANTYSVTVTDVNGCDTVVDVTVSEPPLLAAVTAVTSSFNGQDISCFGASDGAISVAPSGGTLAYTYAWDPTAGSGTDSTVTGLPTGTYSVTVGDANACDTVVSIFIATPPLLIASTTVTSDYNGEDISCFGLSDGAASVTPAGGFGAYTYQWSATAASQTDSLATGLPSGLHTVLVTDTNGCDTLVDITLIDPPLLNVGAAVVSNFNGQDISCFGASDGLASSLPTGGTLPYTYLWDAQTGPSTDSVATGLFDSTYGITLTDVNGCTDDTTITLVHPDLLVGTASVTSDYNGEHLSCFGASDGIASAFPVGGTYPFTYSWDAGTGSQTDSSATGLAAGTYTVTVIDVNGCDTNMAVTVSQPQPLALAYDSINPSCFGFCDGEGSVTPSGGTSPYTYLWDDPNAQTDSLATGLCVGTVSVTVTDANGCTISLSIQLHEPVVLSAAFDSTNVTCLGFCNGIVSAAPAGGTAPYHYLWSDSLAQTDSMATGLCPGTYVVSITDAQACLHIDSLTISEPQVLALAKDSTNVSCFGLTDGDASVIPTGGTQPYTYFWSTGAPVTTSALINLPAGSVGLSVIDSLGCIVQTGFNIEQPGEIVLTTSSDSVTCYEICDGSATVTVVGGSSPFTYLWNDPLAQTTATANLLCDNGYTVTVTDVQGCSALTAAAVGQPDTLIASVMGTDISCNGLCDGTATVNGMGGTTPYTYLWNDPNAQTDTTATGLCSGQVHGLITDSRGCTATDAVTLLEPLPLFGGLFTDSIECNAQCNGTIAILPSGGTMPYTFVWSDPAAQTDSMAQNLCAGVYTLTISDAQGCVETLSDTVFEPDVLVAAVANASHPNCFGATNGSVLLTVTGGTAPFSYQWNDPNAQTSIQATGLAAGLFVSTVTDANGCSTSTSQVLTQPGALTVVGLGDRRICDGDSADISAVASGGAPPYTFDWDNGLGTGQTHTVGPNTTTTYVVTITDGIGCPSLPVAVQIQVTNLQATSINATAIDTSLCVGEPTAVLVQAFGGNGPLQFTWSDGLGDGPGPIPVAPQGDVTYFVTVTDTCGNSLVDDVIITIEPPLEFSLPSVLGEGCEPVEVNLNGLAPNILGAEYIWDLGNGDSLFTQDPLYFYEEHGYYDLGLTVITPNGCWNYASNTASVVSAPGPDSTFTVSSNSVSMADPGVTFVANEPFAASYDWTFDRFGRGTGRDTTFLFPDTGSFTIQLIVTTPAGCIDSSEQVIELLPSYRFQVPTAFTPNISGPGGGEVDYSRLDNDVFFPVTTPAFVTDYRMLIFNRWGEIVFESSDVLFGWDGYYRGAMAPGGVYMVKIDCGFWDGRRELYHGNVTLLR